MTEQQAESLTDHALIDRLKSLRHNARRELNLGQQAMGGNAYATEAQVDEWVPRLYPAYTALAAVARKRGLLTDASNKMA